MNDSIDKLIKEIAAEHGITLSQDDPILILHTINSRLIQDSQKAQEAMLDQYKQELEEMTARWSNDAKVRAERILNAAMIASKEAMAKTLKDGADLVRKEVDSALTRAQAQLRAAHHLSMYNFTAAAITLLATGVLAWIAFYHQ